ncbi:hypothetical protein CFC21_102435 [Triticum aestivum]|uniref:Sulfotransferase n=2 Tax=Triticum aestivum TaxID=4565 RepID=A0A9R1M5Q4_WHEAT|nr:hypothetical protein CFC21_102435 [Triticum aestivum]
MAENNHDAAEEGDGQLLSTLPKKEGMWKPFFLYRGCWLTPRAVTSITLLQSEFAPRPDDVVLATFPNWHYMNKVSADFSLDMDATFELFCEGFSLYGPLWDHVRGYWEQSVAEPDRVLFLKYDDMMADAGKHVKMLAEFLRVPFTVEEVSGGAVEEVVALCSFENLNSLPVNSSGVSDRIGGLPMENSSYFRAGKVGDWKITPTEEMAKKLDDIVQEKLRGSGLAF